MRILLASPIGKAGGIARWTEHILSYYSNVARLTEYELVHLPMSFAREQGVIHRGLWHRVKRGLLCYYQVCRNLDKALCNQSYDSIHFASSAFISLTKDELKQQNNWEWKLLCKVVKMADMVIVIDKSSHDTLLNTGFTNISLLPNPVAPKVSEIVTETKDVERKERTILFVGQGLRTKGIYELVDACRDIPNIRVKMLGAILDSTKEDLYHYSGNAEWLDIVGEIPYEEVIKEMCKCDVFVLPTYTEGFPNVILESMACGCAIVTTSVGAIPEMLEEENGKHYGIMVEPRNVGQLIGGIEKMLSDVDFKNACRVNAQHRVNERYNIDSVWQQMLDIWSKIKRV